ncbi:MAG: DoxX family protein [Actinobacteria bacterium]|nr:DoxX family protein [Actinomycetota bacterium]
MEIGPLLLRVVIGLLFIGHGTQKLFGWFGGHGIEGTVGFYEQLDYPKPRFMAIVAGATEAGSGLLLTLGLFTPLAAAGIIGVMINAAVTAHADNGLWSTNGGYEYNLVLATAAATLAFTGPGSLALSQTGGPVWGLAAIALAVLAALSVLALRSARSTSVDQTTSDTEGTADERQAA